MAGVRGPDILANTLNVPTRRGSSESPWQYHSRSDLHSKVACWTVLFDLLRECDHFRSRAEQGWVGFRINHEIVGPINKTLDLVVTVADPNSKAKARRTFADLVAAYGIVLDASDWKALHSLPIIFEDALDEVREVSIALEAKACMTAHSGALPRLHAEILATGYLAKLGVPNCITVSYTLINVADTFCAPPNGAIAQHVQPRDAQAVVSMVSKALPWASVPGERFGYDAIGVTLIDCANDGSPVTVEKGRPAPKTSEPVHYEQMIKKTCSAFRGRF